MNHCANGANSVVFFIGGHIAFAKIKQATMTKSLLFSGISLPLSLLLISCGGGSTHAGVTSAFSAASDFGAAAPVSNGPAGSSDWPLFVYPQPGDPNVDITQAISWTAANNARAYELQIGTTVGGNDVFDSGIITATSVAIPPLPPLVVLYARVRAILNGWGDASPAGHWSRGSYTSFRTDDVTPASTFTNVGATKALPAGAPVEWTTSPLALGYRLVVTGAGLGTGAPGNGSTTGDTGVIHTTHAFITAPANGKVSATLYTVYLDRTVSAQAEFTATGGAPTFAEQYAFGEELTAEVREMADLDNQPYGASALALNTNVYGMSVASCPQFMATLMQLLQESQVGLTARTLNIGLRGNAYDTHTLVEVLDLASNRWITLDPTFGLVTLRSDGAPAMSSEISAAVRALNWSALSYSLLTPAGSLYANSYYIDYPLLYMNVELPDGSGWVQSPPATLAPYFDPVSLPITEAPVTNTYSLKCALGYTSATAQLNGAAQTLPCSGSDDLTPGFQADDIQLVDASTSVAWQLLRFAF